MGNKGILTIKMRFWRIVPGNAFGPPKAKLGSRQAELKMFSVHDKRHLGLYMVKVR